MKVAFLGFVIAVFGAAIATYGDESTHTVAFVIVAGGVVTGGVALVLNILVARDEGGTFAAPFGARLAACGFGIGIIGFLAELMFEQAAVNKALSVFAFGLVVAGILVLMVQMFRSKK